MAHPLRAASEVLTLNPNPSDLQIAGRRASERARILQWLAGFHSHAPRGPSKHASNRLVTHPATTAGRQRSGSWLGHDVAPRWLRPDVGQAPRERRDQHAVGAHACWRGRGATQSAVPWARGARYSVLAGLGAIGARSQVASKTPTQCRSWVRISRGESRDSARTQMNAAQGYATAPIPCR